MLILRTNKISLYNLNKFDDNFIIRLSKDSYRPKGLAKNEAKLYNESDTLLNYKLYLAFDNQDCSVINNAKLPLIVIHENLKYLDEGDIISVSTKNNNLAVLYRKNSTSNSFLLTERCNHYCLMCSQPPKNIQDDYLIQEVLDAIPLIDKNTEEIGLTGGEPTLLGESLFKIITQSKNFLPNTSLHLLTNGRKFFDMAFSQKYAAIKHPDIVAGIPLYSDVSSIHNYVVQAENAFNETVKGILNLKSLKQKVEIRIVIHKQTYKRLPHLAEYIVRNLTMVDHVALMGLEITGFTRANLNDLWIDPVEYKNELLEAINILSGHRLNVSLYNHQLCLVDKKNWPFYRKSISDWKNEYMPECEGCDEQVRCGGFFSSAKHKYSDNIKPIKT
jgi:His-Xaa-Ser system radical SAM maturase HxsC